MGPAGRRPLPKRGFNPCVMGDPLASPPGRGRRQTTRATRTVGAGSDGASPVPLGPKDYLAQFPDVPRADSQEILELRRLPLVGATRAQLFWLLGHRSVADIAEIDERDFLANPLVSDYPDGSIHEAFPLIQGYAKAIAEDRALVYGPEPLFDHLEGPIWFLDLEFIAGRGEIFLWGIKAQDEGEKKSPVIQWFNHTKRGQREALENFIELVEDVDPLFVAYGSKASDEVSIREAAQRHRLEGAWLKNMRFLDILKRVIFTESPETQRVYLPVRKLKCEHVAVHFGYQKPRDISIKDGYHALQLYRRYQRRPEQRLQERLCAYNAEDLYQTEILFNGLKRLFADQG